METRATAKIKIKATPKIIRTIKVYKKALQFCVDYAWENRIRNNIKLHPFVYKKIRKYGLQSQLAIACIKQACGIIKRAKSKPIIKNISIRYNFPRSASFKNNILSISILKGRIKIPFTVPECYKEYFTWKVCESLLRIDKKGRCFFLFVFSKNIDVLNPSFHKNRVLGIDVGIDNLAVTSDKRFYGKNIKYLRKKRDNLISEIQAKCTKSARRKLKKISGRWKRFMAIENHRISKNIVNNLGAGDIIIMEDLKGIRDSARYNKWVHKWSFYQLQRFIEYKAIRKGIRIVYANPFRTSKTCSRCGSINTIRHSGFFKCLHCSYSLHSDLNASFNLAKSYMLNLGLVDVIQPIVSDDEGKALLSGIELESRNKSPIL